MGARSIEQVPVWIVTGFLGSGKTTLLNRVLCDTGFRQAAVVVGEYGTVGVDDRLLEASPARKRIVDGGCQCGHVHDEIGARLLDLAQSREDAADCDLFDCAIVETSGLDDPVPLVQLLSTDPVITRHYALQSVVTVVDGLHGRECLQRWSEAVKQASVADTVVISKIDLAPPELLTSLQQDIGRLNPAARIFRAIRGDVDARELLAPTVTDGAVDMVSRLAQIEQALSANANTRSAIDPLLATFALSHDEPVTRPGLVLWLHLLAGLRGSGLMRVKGIVNVEGRPVAIHAVQKVVSEPQELAAWPDDDHRTRLVFIVRGMDADDVRTTFQALHTEAGRETRNLVIRPERYAAFVKAIQAFRHSDTRPSPESVL